jgi:hypothetical protein
MSGDSTETPLPKLRATLMARHPGVWFDCTLSVLNDEAVQRISFRGQRELLSFVPERAFKDGAYHSSCDEHGDEWTAYPWEGVWAGWGHIHVVGTETPSVARRWPQKGVQSQVDRMLRKAARPRERANG